EMREGLAAPGLQEGHPGALVPIARPDAALDADRGRVAAGRAGGGLDRFELAAEMLGRAQRREPAVGEAAGALEDHRGAAADPDRDRALDRRRIDAGQLQVVPAPVEGHRLVRPQRAQDADLLLAAAAA